MELSRGGGAGLQLKNLEIDIIQRLIAYASRLCHFIHCSYASHPVLHVETAFLPRCSSQSRQVHPSSQWHSGKFHNAFNLPISLHAQSRRPILPQPALVCARHPPKLTSDAARCIREHRGAALAFVLIGFLSLAIIRVYAKLVEPSKQTKPIMQSSTPASAARRITESELKAATGENGAPIYIAVKDPWSSQTSVFDVSSGADFYGPGGPYNIFAGKDATHGLATSSTDPTKVTGDISKLTEHQKDTHLQWYAKYTSKYPVVGYVVSDDAQVADDVSVVTTESKKDA